MRQGAGALGISLLALCWSGASVAGPNCDDIKQFLQDKAVGVNCQRFDDLRSTTPGVTPANNSILTFADGTPFPGLLGGINGYTPTTDRSVISNGPTPTTKAVPGVQVTGWFSDDATKQARFLLRFPDDWNGKLVVAGSSGTRSEHNGDWAWSDYVLPQGYAYASQNKGVLNLYLVSLLSPTQPAAHPLSCRLNQTSQVWVRFYDNDPDKQFTQWTDYMLKTAKLAQAASKVSYNKFPRRTYAVGTSNGGYQVRRAIEEAPDLFDGGVDWEGTFIDPNGPNLLIDLPPVIKNFPDYVLAGYDPDSQAAKNIIAAGYPPDIVVRNPDNSVRGSLWGRYNASFWEVTMCQWQKRFDPTYDTYGAGLGNYDYLARITTPGVFVDLAAIQTTGKIKKPLVTVAGTMDALLPPERHARAYARAVDASRKGNNDHRSAQHRLYEVQNGNHIEDYVGVSDATNLRFVQLELIQPHAQKAFDLLVDHVEAKKSLPPSQCIPRGGLISASPTQPGQCAALFAP
jgi:alpha-beta hydrolase superfamily lysophospholipase